MTGIFYFSFVLSLSLSLSLFLSLYLYLYEMQITETRPIDTDLTLLKQKATDDSIVQQSSWEEKGGWAREREREREWFHLKELCRLLAYLSVRLVQIHWMQRNGKDVEKAGEYVVWYKWIRANFSFVFYKHQVGSLLEWRRTANWHQKSSSVYWPSCRIFSY